jgi:hypothetical protein
MRDGHRSLGVGAQGEARYAEHRGLLLDAAGVGHDHVGTPDQPEELDVAEGLDQPDPVVVEQTRVDEGLAAPRVKGKHDLDLVSD